MGTGYFFVSFTHPLLFSYEKVACPLFMLFLERMVLFSFDILSNAGKNLVCLI